MEYQVITKQRQFLNYYIESRNTNPFYNLSLEQYVFDSLDRRHSYFMLWQNHNSVIVGKHQNTIEEINLSFVNAHNISVARRLSGGGAVYHDTGNLNFTFITDASDENSINFDSFRRIIKDALVSFGVPACASGRNDITADGKKVSGNAQYVKNGRLMHHGTLLYDCDLDILSNALDVKDDKIKSKGIKSVRSRVANIRTFLKKDMSLSEFKSALKNRLFHDFDLIEYHVTPNQIREIEGIKDNIYSKWSWNYGQSPDFNIRKNRRVEGCGGFEILLDVEKGGVIKNIAFYGDFFSSDDPSELALMMTGHHYEYNEIKNILKNIDISRYFINLDIKTFLAVIFE